MFKGSEVVAVTRGVLVWFDYAASRALPVPEAVRERIRATEAVAPEEKP